MNRYELCDEAWKLYKVWCDLKDEDAPIDEIADAWHKFKQHKKRCKICVTKLKDAEGGE
jgi:hypothetical protein